MALTDAEIRNAEQAMRSRMAAGPHAVQARYDRRRARVVVSLDNGLELAFPPELAEGLSEASPADLADIEISPTGLGLHWPKLDAKRPPILPDATPSGPLLEHSTKPGARS